VDAVRYGNRKYADLLIQGAKSEQYVLLHGLGKNLALGQGVWYPEGGVGKHIIVDEPFQHGEVEWGQGPDGGRGWQGWRNAKLQLRWFDRWHQYIGHLHEGGGNSIQIQHVAEDLVL